MNASLTWLRAIAPGIEPDATAIAHRLAMYGATVDEIVDMGSELRDVRIARVVDAARHPNADRLSLCRVDAGTGELLDVVCGAPNVRAGAFYPFAPVGASLPGGVTIRRAKIRGETSNGMLCSARELGLGRDHEGILELNGTFVPGTSFIEAVGLDDVRLVIDVTPNRPDLLSHWGIARELAPGGEASLVLPPVPGSNGRTPTLSFATGSPVAEAGGIRIACDDTVACPRYYGVIVRGVQVGPSPEWLAARLRTIGARPINNIVDATNWVLHELGQPQHAFDLDALGPRVTVRAARAGETLVTLDGVTRKVTPDVLVITDGTKPVALAGIMGGEASEVRESTRNLLLECALFDPKAIRRGRRQLDLSTDASYRFERGVDPDGMERAVRRCIELILATAGGEVAPSAAFVDAGVAAVPPVRVRPERVERVLGLGVSADRIAGLLEPIGFTRDDAAGAFRVPGHRRYDVSREVDLIEEIARRVGYENVPDEIRPFRPSAVPDDGMAVLEDRLRTQFVAHGFLEARSYPFVRDADGDVALLLPLSAAEGRLRRSLLAGLLRRLEGNYNRGARDVRLFEIGTVFAPGSEALPREETRVAVLMTGARRPAHWSGPSSTFDLWDLRGLVETVGVVVGAHVGVGTTGAPFVEGDSFLLTGNGSSAPIGAGGRVRADALDAPAWAEPVFAFEFTIDAAMAAPVPSGFRELPAQPPVDRDLALLARNDVSAGVLEDGIRAAAGALLESVLPFDVYTGEGVPPGSRSIAFRLRFRGQDRTLTDAEVDDAVARILGRLREEHDVERR
ncbi:MAG: phenylalanine--tRNA ligase subunit beta [Longimicrobiales bacterium]